MKLFPIATLSAAVAGGLFLDAAACGPPEICKPAEPRTIDLAICLDTSGSMSGLIDAARQKLWAIVNDLAMAEPAPVLRVALLTYGNDGHQAENGWVRVDSGLVDDLDLISQQLFAQSTNGGTEYVGRVLQYAGRLDWHPSDDALKLVVVAGNESADQDQAVPFRDMCRDLISRGIMVNSIFCGSEAGGAATGWADIARLADGQYAAIDHNHGTIVVETPFDEQLTQLSSALNETYVPFGASGATGYANQSAQDANAQGLNTAAAASRAVTKSQSLYRCSWDLVDACREGQVTIGQVAAEELPENMQVMSAEQRAAYVEQMATQRASIQTQIADLNQQRQAFVTEAARKQAVEGVEGFDVALRRAVREQARTKGFQFKDEAPKAE